MQNAETAVLLEEAAGVGMSARPAKGAKIAVEKKKQVCYNGER